MTANTSVSAQPLYERIEAQADDWLSDGWGSEFAQISRPLLLEAAEALRNAETVRTLMLAYLDAEEREARCQITADNARENFTVAQPELDAAVRAIEDAMDARATLKAALSTAKADD